MISDPAAITAIVDELLAAHPDEVEAFRGGKNKLQGFFVGQLMKKTGGKADPKLANQISAKSSRAEGSIGSAGLGEGPWTPFSSSDQSGFEPSLRNFGVLDGSWLGSWSGLRCTLWLVFW